MSSRQRLDLELVQRGFFSSREEAKAAILAGNVWSHEVRLEKAGTLVEKGIPIVVKERPRFVGRGGEKLQAALEAFRVSPKDWVCMDVGASTGGFTDCLLQNGAAMVIAVDAGYGQIDFRLRNDPRVIVLERTNARYLTPFHPAMSQLHSSIRLVVIDVSFISLEKVLFPLVDSFSSVEHWICLFKPQFQVGRKWIGRGGVVRDPKATEDALAKFLEESQQKGFTLDSPPLQSPVQGKKSGNQEYLIYFHK